MGTIRSQLLKRKDPRQRYALHLGYWSGTGCPLGYVMPPVPSRDVYADVFSFFVLEVDASHGGLGAAPCQEQGGRMRLIVYASPGLRPQDHNRLSYRVR